MIAMRRLSGGRTALINSQDGIEQQGQSLLPDSSNKEDRTKHQSELRVSWLAWIVTLLTVGFLILTCIYASGIMVASRLRFLYSSSSNAIFVLSVLSGFTGIFLSATISATFEKLQWSLISREDGLRVTKYLSLQAGTGIMGLLMLIWGKGVRWQSSTRLWATLRLAAIILGPALGILIMSDVNTHEEFIIIDNTPTVLGWGMSPFNASLAKNVSAIADQVAQADLSMFLSQPYRTVDMTPPSERSIPCSHVPGTERKVNCRRVYYIPGGMDLAANRDTKGTAGAEILLALNQQGYILEFVEGPGVGEQWSFDAETECKVYGFPIGAIHLCLKNGAPNTLHARIVHCPEAVSSSSSCISNVTWPSAPGWTTSLTTSFQNGTVAYSLANGSILSHTFTSDPIPAPVSATDMLAGYRSAFSLFDNLPAVLAALADPKTVNMFPLYVYPAMVWANLKSISTLSAHNPAALTRAQDALQCLLGIMLFYCQPSFFASSLSMYVNASSDDPQEQSEGKDISKLKALAEESLKAAPPDTTTRQAVRRYQLLVGRNTLITYSILCGGAILACLVALAWCEWRAVKETIVMPPIGSFPAWDERIRTEVRRNGNHDVHNDAFNGKQGGDRMFVSRAENMRIVLARQRTGWQTLSR